MPKIDMTSVFQASAAAKCAVQCQCGVSKSSISRIEASAPPMQLDGGGFKRRHVGAEPLEDERAGGEAEQAEPQQRQVAGAERQRHAEQHADKAERHAEPLPRREAFAQQHGAERRGQDRMEGVHQRGRGGIDRDQRRMRHRRPKPCSSAPPSRRSGQDFRRGQLRPVTTISSARRGRRDRKPRADQREGRRVNEADLGGDIG